MEKNTKVSKLVFFIPARSGSTRLKNKNLKKFKQTSLLINKIRVCLATKLGDVIVSTNSSKIANIAIKHKAKVIGLRNKYLSTSKASMISSVIDFVNNLKKNKINNPSHIAIVPVTYPLLKISSIKKIYNKFLKLKKFNSITSVYLSRIDPFNIIDFNKKKIVFDIFKFKNKSYNCLERSQDRPKFHKISSAIQISKIQYFLKFKNKKNLLNIKAKPFDIRSCCFYKINSLESYDVNTATDYKVLKKLIKIFKLFKLIAEKYV